ncbi:hypothetical protein BDC45DRAFT_499079, partial [Circinella umbellata]
MKQVHLVVQCTPVILLIMVFKVLVLHYIIRHKLMIPSLPIIMMIMILIIVIIVIKEDELYYMKMMNQ